MQNVDGGARVLQCAVVRFDRGSEVCGEDTQSVASCLPAVEDPAREGVPAEMKAPKRLLYTHLRAALADGRSGPGIADMMEVLGRDECLTRMMNYVSA